MLLSECCAKKVAKTRNLTQLFLNGNQQKEHISDYTLCDFQVVSLKREFSTVFQSYLGSKKSAHCGPILWAFSTKMAEVKI